MTQRPEDKSILREIVRVVEARRRVPDRVQVHTHEYVITYLEDHRNRLEEALRRYDPDRLNMLFGQLASKVKYQFSRLVPARKVEPKPVAPKEAKASKKAGVVKASGKSVKKAVAKKVVAKKPAAKKAVAKKVAKKAAKKVAKKAAKKKPVAKKAAKKSISKKHK